MSGPRGLFVGLTTIDLVHRVERAPGADEKVVAHRADLAAGGPATGAAVTFAALGGQATLLTVVGQGPLADLARTDLGEQEVTVVDAGPYSPGPAISAATVVAGTGERSVVSRNAEGVVVDAMPDVDALVADADVVLVDGHHPALATAAAEAAQRAGVPVVLDAGSWKPVLADLLPLTTMAVCSAAFRHPPLDDEGDGEHVAAGRGLLPLGPRVVVVTDGPNPVRWWTDGEDGVEPVPEVDAQDTLGAGDAFHGAYAHAVADGSGPGAAARFAAHVASVRVAHVGPRSWLAELGTTLGPSQEPAVDPALVERARHLAASGRRVLLGVTGAPGSGKSTLAQAVVEALGDVAVLVGMDGFHLAEAELHRLHRHDRKGAPDTFDAAGYVALLRRLHANTEPVVYAPSFDRSLEEPIGSAVPVPREVPLVVTEGNYLLVDDGDWAQVAPLLDECWFVDAGEEERVRRLLARHRRYGRSERAARERTLGSDQRNADVVAATRDRADLVVVGPPSPDGAASPEEPASPDEPGGDTLAP